MKNKLFGFLFFLSTTLFSQYTETINSNRPGTSHGAFSIGTNVLQFEIGGNNYSLSHLNLNNSKIRGIGVLYNIRYGLYFENLEIFVKGGYIDRRVKDNFKLNLIQKESFLSEHTVGLKYLFFDPFKNKKWHSEDFYSWKSSKKIKWTDLFPAISLFAGGEYIFNKKIQFDDHYFNLKQEYYGYEDQKTFSPFFGLATQNHFLGKWVVVNNISLENIGSDYIKINYIFTLTHNLKNPRWSIFAEYQIIDNKIYSDNFFKFGIANLVTKNLQVDLNFGGSFKDTPSNSYVDFGFSKRIDWHKDELLIDRKKLKEFRKKIKQENKAEKVNTKDSKKVKKQNKKKSRLEKKQIKKANKPSRKKFIIF